MSDATYRAVIALAKTGFRALGQDLSVQGHERLPRTGGALLAINHIGYADFVYAGVAAERIHRLVRFMAKREVFDHGVAGRLMRAMRHISVDRAEGEASLRVAEEYLRRGELVGIFPEATISRGFELKEFKTGAVRIAAAARVPLFPVVVWGTQRLVTKDHPRDLTRGRPISIRVGEPLTVTGVDPVAETAQLKESMHALLDATIRSYPDQEPGAWWLPASYGGSAPTLAEAARLDAEERAARAARKAARAAGTG